MDNQFIPELFNDENGNLYMKISIGDHYLVKKIPPFKTNEEYTAYVRKEAPNLIREVIRKKNSSAKRFKRRVRNAKIEKRRVNTEGSHLRSVTGVASSTDNGEGGV